MLSRNNNFLIYINHVFISTWTKLIEEGLGIKWLFQNLKSHLVKVKAIDLDVNILQPQIRIEGDCGNVSSKRGVSLSSGYPT